ncbi:PPP family 3-phenylpropionic acid transporter [Bacilli bacterium PM5-3]|nr:PPP family 3-phenylpropionic acid transporter [Bacilli bacterium PM5-3]MDH6603606.1 PPP family 3-phenylpropionic acid transporter [Bacilli bacterium PM5-9]
MTITQRARLYYVFTDYFNGTLLTYLPLFLKEHYHYTGSELGTILFVAGIFAIIGILIGPPITNIFKKEKSTLIIENLLMLLAIGTIFMSDNFILVTIATGLCYLNRMAMYSIGDNLMSDIGNEHGIPFGKFRSFGSIGWGLCFLVNGFLVIKYPNYFILVWATLCVLAIINLLKLQERKKEEKQANLIDVKTVVEMSSYKNAIKYLMLVTLLYVPLQTASSFINFLILELDGKVEIFSTLTAALVIVEFLVMFFAHKLRQRLTDQQYFELIAILLICKFAIISFATSPILVYCSALFDPVIFGMILPFNPSYLKDSVPNRFNATILSFFGIISLIAMALYSKLAGNIMDIYSTKMVFIVYLGIAILVLVLTKILKIKNHKS